MIKGNSKRKVSLYLVSVTLICSLLIEGSSLCFAQNVVWTVTENPSGSHEEVQAICSDDTYIYVAGQDLIPGNEEWRIQKRNKSDGSIVWTVTENPSSSHDVVSSITSDTNYIYLGGYDYVPGYEQWRIQKRRKSDGSIVWTVTNADADSSIAYATTCDDTYVYAAGYDSSTGDQQWRIEKRNKSDGSLIWAKTENPSSKDEGAYHITSDDSYIYVTGGDYSPGGFGDDQCIIQKRNKSDGSIVWTVTENPSSTYDSAGDIICDDTYLYTGGHDSSLGGLYDDRWRIQKRNKSDGSVVWTETEDLSSCYDTAYAITSDDKYIYVCGRDSSPGYFNFQWRIQKRNKSNGSVVWTETENPSSSEDVPFAITLDSTYIYVAGADSSQGERQWRIQKREKQTETVCQASFQGLGDLEGGSFGSSALGISADGSTVVGQGTSASGQEAFRWTECEGMIGLGDLNGGGFSSRASSVSADGSVIVGEGLSDRGAEAFHWSNNTIIGLGYLPGYNKLYSDGMDVSNDGFFIVGESHSGSGYQAFRWEDINRNGTADNDEQLDDHPEFGLGDLSGGSFYSSTSGISSDGSVVVGWGHSDLGQEAFHWTETTGMIGLGDLPGGTFQSVGRSSSVKGLIIVGFSFSSLGKEAFRWEDLNGNGLVDINEKLEYHPEFGLGDLSGGPFKSEAMAVSADGSVVVGWGSSTLGEEAFIWDQCNGMRNLKDVLENDYGLDLTGWTLHKASGISDNGLTIVGYGTNPDGNTEAWIAKIYKENAPPIADAGEDQTVYSWIDGFAEVTLDGSDSYDPDGDQLTYLWSWVVDSNPYETNGVSPTIELPVGNHTIELVANDGAVDSEPDYVEANLIAPLQTDLCVIPSIVNRSGFLKNILAIMELPEGIQKDDIQDEKFTLYPAENEEGIEATCQYTLTLFGRVITLALFSKAELMDAVPENGWIELNVVGKLESGQYFYGSDTIKIIDWH